MKRGSIVGPVILILIGAAFLIHNLQPQWSALEFISRYWPGILIAWGVIRLLEIFIWAARSKPLPTKGVSGGEWALIVLVTLFASGVTFAHRHAGWLGDINVAIDGLEVFKEGFDYQIPERRVSASDKTGVHVENFRGNVRIIGAETSEVSVVGRKVVRALRQEDADQADRLTAVDVDTSGATIIIRTNNNRARRENSVTTDLEVTVPKGMAVEGIGRHGDFDVRDLNGRVDIRSDNAGVRLESLGGDVLVDLRRSDVVKATNIAGKIEIKGRGRDLDIANVNGEVVVSGSYGGELTFRNLERPLRIEGEGLELKIAKIPGEIRLERGHFYASNIVGPTVFNGRSKDIEIDGFSNTLDLRIDKGDVQLQSTKPTTANVTVATHSGRIELALPENDSFSLNGTVNKGEARNDFGGSVRITQQGRGALMTRAGKGQAMVTLTTDRGELILSKSSEADLHALTPQPLVPPTRPSPPEPPDEN
jgi:DUF4097 and DUF4098 domain-containing protein YvlB